MIEALFKKISEGTEIKNNLLELKNRIKEEVEEGTRKDALLIIANNYNPVLISLLDNDDPKIRKNAVIIIGMLGLKENLEAVFSAYEKDEINYNKAAYVKAIAGILKSGCPDFDSYLERLKARRLELLDGSISVENRKHIIEEIHELNDLLHVGGGHVFSGFSLPNEIILLTNRNFKAVTAKKLGSIPNREFTAGLMVKTHDLASVMSIRTFSEILFVPSAVKTCPSDADSAAKTLFEKGITDYIAERHAIDDKKLKDEPFRFRVELRCDDVKRKSAFEKRFASEFEILTGFSFINSTDDYELEFRFIESSDKKNVNTLIRFCTLKDSRFAYRRESIAAGMKPYLAALICELAAPYMKANAAVLDPFCGTGTLIAEREKVCPARLYYGIDIFKEAIEKADRNLSAAGLSGKTELITKDFAEFRHEHRFNEIITDMPFVTMQKDAASIDKLYRMFFERITMLLEPDPVLIVYSRNRDFLRKHALACHFTIKSEFEISKKENSYLFILGRA